LQECFSRCIIQRPNHLYHLVQDARVIESLVILGRSLVAWELRDEKNDLTKAGTAITIKAIQNLAAINNVADRILEEFPGRFSGDAFELASNPELTSVHRFVDF